MTGPFPREEYEERLGRLRRVMVERRLDTLIVDTCEMPITRTERRPLRCGEDTGETP